MGSSKALLVAALVVFGSWINIAAQERGKTVPDAAQEMGWQKAARTAGLNAAEIQQLGRDKVLVTDQAFLQVFAPYVSWSEMPVFITSDSLLNGFHVLFEESIFRIEQQNARRLPGVLQHLWARLSSADGIFRGNPRLIAAAKTRARATIATAIRLLDEKARFDEPIGTLVRDEAPRVEAAQGLQKPKWLGPPDPGFLALDYSRYRPRGFYTRSDALKRYFRAVSWLQSIPFRLENDEELSAILMLSQCINVWHVSRAEEREWATFDEAFRKFLGPADDWTVSSLSTRYSNGAIDLDGDGLKPLRQEYRDYAAKRGEGPRVNDQAAFAPADPSRMAELTFRVLPSRRTPDAALFQRTTDLRRFQRRIPTGLEVCAALGSSFARSRLAGTEDGRLLTEIDRFAKDRPVAKESSLYGIYLHCLAALLEETGTRSSAVSVRRAVADQELPGRVGGLGPNAPHLDVAGQTVGRLPLRQPPSGRLCGAGPRVLCPHEPVGGDHRDRARGSGRADGESQGDRGHPPRGGRPLAAVRGASRVGGQEEGSQRAGRTCFARRDDSGAEFDLFAGGGG